MDVVADEIRKLAEQTLKSTDQIKNIIDEIQGEISLIKKHHVRNSARPNGKHYKELQTSIRSSFKARFYNQEILIIKL